MRAREMLRAHRHGAHGAIALGAAIEACHECAQVCQGCADACLAEDNVAALRLCISLDLDCADICLATAGLLTRRTEGQSHLADAQLDVCIQACQACAAECRRHADAHVHCRICAEACEACAEACQKAKSSALVPA